MKRLARLGSLLVLLVSWQVMADPHQLSATPEPVTNLPWVKGVPFNNQEEAFQYFRQGNQALKDSNFIQAIQDYGEALKRWDHPAIHYNLSLALMRFDRPIEVYEHLEAATRYGPKPLEADDRYEYSRNYKALLDKQLVMLRLDCQKRGATVTLDGKTVFVAPGHYEARVNQGVHVINATLEGYLPTDKSRTFLGGEQVTVDLKLYTEQDTTRSRRRWAAWMPWVITGGGLALAAGGGLLQVRAQNSYRAFDAGITQCGGCKVEGDAAKARLLGDRMRVSSWGAYAVGGGALLTGTVLLYLNRSQTYRIDPETGNERVAIVPLVGPVNGLQASGSF